MSYSISETIRKAMLKEEAENWYSFINFCHEVRVPITSLRRILKGGKACARNWTRIVYYYHHKILRESIEQSIKASSLR